MLCGLLYTCVPYADNIRFQLDGFMCTLFQGSKFKEGSFFGEKGEPDERTEELDINSHDVKKDGVKGLDDTSRKKRATGGDSDWVERISGTTM